MLMLEGIAEYPENWMFIISKDKRAYQCLGCLYEETSLESDIQEVIDQHEHLCSQHTAELAISRYELVKALEDIARLEYQQGLNDYILKDILLRGGLWANIATQIGWLTNQNGNYYWNKSLDNVMEYFSITEDRLSSNPKLIYPGLSYTRDKEQK